MKVSFDYDGTLSYPSIRVFATLCKTLGCELWIVTSRFKDKDNEELYEVAEKLEIPEERIIFTSWADKSDFFEKNSDFLFHADDDFIEVELINERTSVKGIDIFADAEWQEKCLTLISEKL
jgi:hypothetical protein